METEEGNKQSEPAQQRAVTEAPAATQAAPADAPSGGTGPEADGGGPESAASAAARKRRRGRRGGKRHRRKPAGAGTAGASGDEPDGDQSGTDAPAAAGENAGEAPKPARAPRPQGQRPPRQPRPPKPEGEGAAPAQGGEAPAPAEAGGPSAAEAGGSPAAEAGAEASSSPTTSAARRRRRRRGRGGGGGGGGGAVGGQSRPAASADKPAADGTTKTEGAKPAAKQGEAKPSDGGSTRLAARKIRKQQQQARGRRPRKRLTEEEARQLRGAEKVMLIHEHDERTQIAVLEEGTLIEHFVARRGQRASLAGGVFLGKVQNVLPGMEAAFVDFGRGRNGVLYAGEVNYSAEDLEGEAPRIEKVLKSGQSLLVQVTKDPIGTKGARLTTQISLAGRYMVLAPEQPVTGISRRLAENERSRLRQILREIRPNGHGVIIRTAAEGASKEALERDLQGLIKIWDDIQKASKKAKPPAALYEEPELVMKVVRDIFSGDFGKVIVDSRSVHAEIVSYVGETAPDLADKVELYDGALPLFEQHRVTEQLHKALERKVWLPSGGSLIIDRTEAMTVIDVNTGKFTGKGSNLEETVFLNNLEAAEEIARQLRLRDIGGIIVVDFIDMIDPKNQQELLRTLKRALQRDKTRSQVFEVSNLGLVEMTRKKVSEGLLDAFSDACPNCEGRGIVLTHEID